MSVVRRVHTSEDEHGCVMGMRVARISKILQSDSESTESETESTYAIGPWRDL